MDEQEAKKACLEIRDRHFSEHLDNRIDDKLKTFAIDKGSVIFYWSTVDE